MGKKKHTTLCSLHCQARRSECLHWLPACGHPDSEDSVHLLFIAYTEALQGMFCLQCWARIPFLPVWYVLQQTCHVKNYTMTRLPIFIKTRFTAESWGFRKGRCC